MFEEMMNGRGNDIVRQMLFMREGYGFVFCWVSRDLLIHVERTLVEEKRERA